MFKSQPVGSSVRPLLSHTFLFRTNYRSHQIALKKYVQRADSMPNERNQHQITAQTTLFFTVSLESSCANSQTSPLTYHTSIGTTNSKAHTPKYHQAEARRPLPPKYRPFLQLTPAVATKQNQHVVDIIDDSIGESSPLTIQMLRDQNREEMSPRNTFSSSVY